MINANKQEHALRALHEILVVARSRANQSGDKRLFDLLDAAEILPKYIAEAADRTLLFRQAIKDLGALCPESAYIIDDFDSEFVGAW
jgi:hypothetical protein